MTGFMEIIGYITTASKGIKAIADVATDASVQQKTVELNNVIIPLQSAIMEMQAEHQNLIDVKNSLEQELLNYKNWDSEKSNYELKEVSFGVRVYVEKTGEDSVYNRMWLCPKCFHENKKGILQLQRAHPSPREYICHSCNSLFRVRQR
ncbi:MAG: hypothetical protein ACU826_05370 [Gammaproteobacteria bacterium]